VFSALGPDGLVALLLRFGPRGAGLVPFGHGLSLGRLRRDPHGIDFGPLEPSLPRRLYTKTRRIELAPERLVEDLKRLRLALEAPANGGLALVGRRELRSNNSWMHNSERLVKGQERCTLLMHPQDASARGLRHGERVRVASHAGVVEAPLEVSDEMRPGVVSLPHGWGHQRAGVRLTIASARPGVSFNDLSDEALVDPLCGTARLNDVPVEVTSAVDQASGAVFDS